MHKFNISSSLKLAGFDLKKNRKSIIGWCVALFLIMFMYMILFPSMKDVAQMKMDAMPKELLQFFGMEQMAELTNFIGYFGMIFSLILIAISIFSASFSANLIFREEKLKTIEFLYSLEVSRTEIYISKLITAFVASLAAILSAAVGTAVCGFINGGESFVFADFLQILKISGITVFFFMAVSLMLAGLTTRIGVSAVGSMIVLVCYLLGYLSKLLESKADWLVYFSPFELFSPQRALALDSSTMIEYGICFALIVAFVFVGGFAYKRRDFNI